MSRLSSTHSINSQATNNATEQSGHVQQLSSSEEKKNSNQHSGRWRRSRDANGGALFLLSLQSFFRRKGSQHKQAPGRSSSDVALFEKSRVDGKWHTEVGRSSSDILHRGEASRLRSRFTWSRHSNEQQSRELESSLDAQVRHQSEPTNNLVKSSMECLICCSTLSSKLFLNEWFTECGHRACLLCLRQYLVMSINEARPVQCHACTQTLHPNDVANVLLLDLGDVAGAASAETDEVTTELVASGLAVTGPKEGERLLARYEEHMVRRVLATDPDMRWCPAPDCGFGLIATGCASCPFLTCARAQCGVTFCYHCKDVWHPTTTCDQAREQRRNRDLLFAVGASCGDTYKPCPRCGTLIQKVEDGSCNHMNCQVCHCEFCWLCMKEISDLHYLSPSGCTFWGKKQWSRQKKIFWQLGTLLCAPLGIGLAAGIAVPAMIIGIPVWVGREVYDKLRQSNKHKRNLAVVGSITGALLVSPLLASLAVSIGVPILLAYVYGIVPVSLCRGSNICGAGLGGDESDGDEEDANAVETISGNVEHGGGVSGQTPWGEVGCDGAVDAAHTSSAMETVLVNASDDACIKPHLNADTASGSNLSSASSSSHAQKKKQRRRHTVTKSPQQPATLDHAGVDLCDDGYDVFWEEGLSQGGVSLDGANCTTAIVQLHSDARVDAPMRDATVSTQDNNSSHMGSRDGHTASSNSLDGGRSAASLSLRAVALGDNLSVLALAGSLVGAKDAEGCSIVDHPCAASFHVEEETNASAEYELRRDAPASRCPCRDDFKQDVTPTS